MPTGPMGLPGAQGGPSNSPFFTGMSRNIPPNLQTILQSMRSSLISQSPQPSRGFWNPNQGMPSPTIANNTSINSPTTPFSMPRAPTQGIGVPSEPDVTNPQGNIPSQQATGTVDQYNQPLPSQQPLAPPSLPYNMRSAGGFASSPGANNMWSNLPMPAVRGTAVTGQPR